MLILHLVLATSCKEEEEPKAQQPKGGKRGRQDTYLMTKAYLAL